MGNGLGLAGIFASADDLSGLVRFAQPCIERYRDIFHPRSSLADALTHIYRRMLSDGHFQTDAPEWVSEQSSEAVGYVVIDDYIMFSLKRDPRNSHPFVAFTLGVRQLS